MRSELEWTSESGRPVFQSCAPDSLQVPLRCFSGLAPTVEDRGAGAGVADPGWPDQFAGADLSRA